MDVHYHFKKKSTNNSSRLHCLYYETCDITMEKIVTVLTRPKPISDKGGMITHEDVTYYPS